MPATEASIPACASTAGTGEKPGAIVPLGNWQFYWDGGLLDQKSELCNLLIEVCLMEMFNFGFWLTIPVFLLIGSIPALIGGVVTYFINRNVDENKRVECAEKVTLVLLVLFSCGICNFWWSQ